MPEGKKKQKKKNKKQKRTKSWKKNITENKNTR